LLTLAHRGASAYEPENTLRAIRRALEIGVAGIEIDVHFIRGELLVIHDSKLDRTTNGRGPLRRHTLEHLRNLDAGKGERIPLLAEVLDLVNRSALINIELKGRRTAAPVHKLLAQYIAQRGWTPSHFIISSFSRIELRAFHALRALPASTRPSEPIPIGILFARSARLFRPLARKLDAYSIHVPLSQVTPRLVSRVQADGRKLFVYTVNDPVDKLRMAALGVDAIFTDAPG
jgi:glycerophosphoryl diester phosphodiesterase